MYELNFITDIVEEQLAKGNLRWLANFKEIHRDYAIGDLTVPVYALGGLQERGFFLSRIFSAFVTPKYKVHFLLYTSNDIDVKFLRKLVVSCKGKFGPDDWIFIELVQSKPIEKAMRDAVRSIADDRVGVVASSLASKEEVFSDNVLGKGLKKQLKLVEARFEAFDAPDYLKGFAIVFFLGTLMLIVLQFFLIPAINPVTLLLMLAFSIIMGYPIYKKRYHTVLRLNDRGFEIWKGKSSTKGKWADYADVAIYVAPNRESFLRLYSKGASSLPVSKAKVFTPRTHGPDWGSKEGTFDLPLSRVGISRKEAYNAIKQLLRKK